jgi:hypothetical protein
MPTTSLQATLTWLNFHAEQSGEYTITINANESISLQTTLFYSGRTVNITLTGDTTERTVRWVGVKGSLFTVGSGVTLILDNNVTLQGRSDNSDNGPLVRVKNGGTLVMNAGSKISGNATLVGGSSGLDSEDDGGGVYVDGLGTFTMNGGAISGNTAFDGGGVYGDGLGTFTMNGGAISGNTAPTIIDGAMRIPHGGGGVYVDDPGTFTMNDGEISGNTASGTSCGGGVYAELISSDSWFTMSGGVISGNTAASYGGGVYAEVSGNGGGTFWMSGGAISGNTALGGGGVYVAGGGNGGMFPMSSGRFTKQSGGVIYGSNASYTLKNTAQNDEGHAVYVSGDSKERNTTAGEGDTLDSRKNGAAGGWE